MSIANVTLSNTFDEWRVRHNVITINVNDLQDNTAGLNVVAANTIYAYQRVRIAPGTENAPSLTFNTDVGSGMYSPANGQLGFSTNNVNALLFDKNRNATFSNNVTLKTLTINTGNAITGVDYSGVSNNNTVLPTSRVVLVKLGNYTSNTYAQNTFSQLGHSHTLSDITDSGAAAAKSVTGADSAVVTGTAGTNGNIIQWNVDGDAVDSGQSTSGVSNHIASTSNPHSTTKSQVGLSNVPNEDATDMYNWDQKGATDGQAPVWNSSNSRYEPANAGDDLSNLPSSILGQVSTNQTLDLQASRVFELEPTADITISATGLASSGRAVGYLTIINGGAVTLSFGSNFVFESGSVPTFSGTGFDLTTASYNSVSFGVGTEDSQPQSIAFNGDGTKMFMIGTATNSVYQYSLTTGFDLSTASYDNVSVGVDTEDGNPLGFAFNGDGTKMFMVGFNSSTLYQYSLTTGFDLTTASYNSVSFGVGTEDNGIRDIAFNGDGTKMFMMGGATNSVYQYSLTTGFDLSTASYDSVSFGVDTEDTSPRGIAFNGDGTKMFMVGNNNATLYQYSLTTGFDLSTASYDSVSFGVGTEDTGIRDIAFNGDGTKMFMAGFNSSTMYQYSLGFSQNVFNVLKLVQQSTDKLLASVTHKGNI